MQKVWNLIAVCLCVQMIRAADPKTRPQVLEILDSASDLGLKVLRIWAFSEGPIQYNTLQRYPGLTVAPMCITVTGPLFSERLALICCREVRLGPGGLAESPSSTQALHSVH